LHNTFSPSKPDSENKAENKQTTANSQNLHKQTNEKKRKQKEEERIIFIEQKKLHKLHHKNSQEPWNQIKE
jgi:hypothetical protein